MTRRGLVRALGALRRGGARPAYGQNQIGGVGKDFSVVPVCGSVRPLADQRARHHRGS